MTTQKYSVEEERALLVSARLGDERAYEVLIEGHRAELHAHCYRMLASVHDADDAVQETLIRAWKGLSQFESRSSIRTWLFKIATNSSFDVLKKRSRRELPLEYSKRAGPGESPGDALLDAPWMEPYPDQWQQDVEKSPEARYEALEGLELAFIVAIQHIAPRQRAVLILREVLGFSVEEIGELLETSVAAVNSSLQRARVTVANRMPVISQQRELRTLGDVRVRDIARRYAEAIDRGDIAALVGMLTHDATWSMPPHPAWYRGVEAIAEFHAQFVANERWRHVTSSANGQLAIGCYTFNPQRDCYVASVLDVLTIEGGFISTVTAFITPYVLRQSGEADENYVGLVDFARFGLPQEVDK
jgi:RNA polymerase sigma-70 factor (ECF subfamily)